MAKLITNHDPYHVHKILGVFVLLHFVFRLTVIAISGDVLVRGEPKWVTTLGLLAHGLLSWSSLLLPLPKKRNFSAPMIWPEFRLHSITFATRHVVCALLTLHDTWPQGTSWAHAASKWLVLMITIGVASKITKKWGNRETRTTNAMPYPAIMTEVQRKQIKKEYAEAQFNATVAATMPDVTSNWVPLLAIQMAPLLMTLVRKGKITSLSYHRIYSISLLLGTVVTAVRISNISEGWLFLYAAVCMIFIRWLRFRHQMPAWTVWTIYSILCFGPYGEFKSRLDNALEPRLIAIVWAPVILLQLKIYGPLFAM